MNRAIISVIKAFRPFFLTVLLFSLEVQTAQALCIPHSQIMKSQRLQRRTKGKVLFYTRTTRQIIRLDMVEIKGRHYYNFRHCFDYSSRGFEVIEKGFNYDPQFCNQEPHGVHKNHGPEHRGGLYGELSSLWLPVVDPRNYQSDTLGLLNDYLLEELEKQQDNFVSLEAQNQWLNLRLALAQSAIEGGFISLTTLMLIRSFVGVAPRLQTRWSQPQNTQKTAIAAKAFLWSLLAYMGVGLATELASDKQDHLVFEQEWEDIAQIIQYFDRDDFVTLLKQNPKNHETVLGLISEALSNAMKRLNQDETLCDEPTTPPSFMEQQFRDLEWPEYIRQEAFLPTQKPVANKGSLLFGQQTSLHLRNPK